MKKLTWVVTVLAVTAALLAAPGAAAARSTATYDVWQWNVAGDAMHRGSADTGMVDAAVSSIIRRGTDLAAFNELCWQQYKALQSRLRSAGWPRDPDNFSRFAHQVSGVPSVCGGQAFGVAVFSTAPLQDAHFWRLPSDGLPDQRRLLCAALEDQPEVRFCTTHITTSGAVSPRNGRPHNVNQLGTVLDRLEAYAVAGDTVLIAGDFNAQPNYGRLNNWYSSSLNVPANRRNTGSYRELDDKDSANCAGYGEGTAAGPPGAVPPCAAPGVACTASTAAGCAKIDLIFVREDRIAGGYWGDSLGIATSCRGVPNRPDRYLPGSCSDHRVVLGRVTVLTGS